MSSWGNDMSAHMVVVNSTHRGSCGLRELILGKLWRAQVRSPSILVSVGSIPKEALAQELEF